MLGIVTVTDIKGVSRAGWDSTTVENIMTREPLYTVSPEDTVNTALRMLAQHNINQVLVENQGQCAGLITRADIINHLRFVHELGLGKR